MACRNTLRQHFVVEPPLGCKGVGTAFDVRVTAFTDIAITSVTAGGSGPTTLTLANARGFPLTGSGTVTIDNQPIGFAWSGAGASMRIFSSVTGET